MSGEDVYELFYLARGKDGNAFGGLSRSSSRNDSNQRSAVAIPPLSGFAFFADSAVIVEIQESF
jgi:hypothetical protein